MNLRERILAAVSGREAYPIPCDLSCNVVYPKLQAGLCRHYHVAEGDVGGLLEAVGSHLRFGWTTYCGPPLEEGLFGVTPAYPATKITKTIWGTWYGLESYTSEVSRPLAGVESLAEIENHVWPSPDLFDYDTITWGTYSHEFKEPLTEWLARNADYARVVGDPWMPVFSRIMDLCGMEHGLYLMAARPDLVHALVERIGGFLEAYYERIARATAGRADFIRFADDFASQQGMMISPNQWREYFLPLWRRLFAMARRYGLRPWLHSCGSIRPVLGDLIDAGLEVFETVQIHARDMEPGMLKREFGADLTFYGGVDTQSVLPNGSPEDVRREAMMLIETLGRGGRYILTSSHTLMDDVPVDNAVAMFEVARTYIPTAAQAPR